MEVYEVPEIKDHRRLYPFFIMEKKQSSVVQDFFKELKKKLEERTSSKRVVGGTIVKEDKEEYYALFALTGDLFEIGFDSFEIEKAVNSGEVKYSNWPLKKPVTTVYWVEDNKTLENTEKYVELVLDIVKKFEEEGGIKVMDLGRELNIPEVYAIVYATIARDKGKIQEYGGAHTARGTLYFLPKSI